MREIVLARARCAAALALLGLPLPSARPALAQVAGQEREIFELLSAAGVSRQLQEWPELTVPTRDRARAKLDAPSLALLQRAVAELFDGEVLMAGVADRLADIHDEGRVAAALEWYGSPIGQRLRSADERSATPEALRELPVFMSQLDPRHVRPYRRLVATRLDRAAQITRSALAVSRAVSRSLTRGVVALDCGTEADAAAPALREIKRMNALEGVVRERVVIRLLFAYRSVPTADLVRYADFLESEAGRWIFGDLTQHLAGALTDAGERLLGRLAPEVVTRCSGTPP